MDMTSYFLQHKNVEGFADWAFTSPKEYSMLPVQYGLNIDCPNTDSLGMSSFIHPWHQLESNMFSHRIRQLDTIIHPINSSPAPDTSSQLVYSVQVEENIEAQQEQATDFVEQHDSVSPMMIPISVHTEIPHRDQGLMSLTAPHSMVLA